MQEFYSRLRVVGNIFPGGKLSQPQVDGINSIISACEVLDIRHIHYVAYILATVYHETGGYMYPIKETVFGSHTNKNPSDATVIQRLDSAYAKGQLPWVTKPYWRDGWFGRGMVQITHRDNYKRMGDRLGIDLVGNPNLALVPEISATIAVVGMMEGMFRGDKNGPIGLTRFDFPQALKNPVASNPRRIINGQDGTDATVAKYHLAFHASMSPAGYGTVTPVPVPEEPVRTRAQIVTEIRALLDELERL